MRKVIGKTKYKHSIPKRFNYILPRICGLALLLIGWLIINPVGMTDRGFAVEDSEDASNNAKSTASIGIAWTNPSNLERETNGQSGEVTYRYDTFTLSASKIKQYQIFVNAATGSSGQLEGYLDADRTIPIGNVGGISNVDGVIGKNMGANEWGYAVSEGYKVSNAELEQLTYKAVPAASSTKAAFTGTEATLTDKQFTVAFGANVGSDKPAGHYTAYVTVSAVMEPRASSWNDIKYMQDMTAEICNEGDDTGKRLIDERDNKLYWVAKLKDGNCWMTQNLAYDGGGEKMSNSVFASNGSAKYYNAGAYIYTTPMLQNRCSQQRSGLASCVSHGWERTDDYALYAPDESWTATNDPDFYSASSYTASDGVTTCTKRASSYFGDMGSDYLPCRMYSAAYIEDDRAHYLAGNYYNYSAATNGTGISLTSGVASDNVCPEQWILPTPELLNTLVSGLKASTTDGTDNIKLAPYYYVYTGSIDSNGLTSAGEDAYYMTSNAINANMINLMRLSTSVTLGASSGNRFRGTSVRCVAR